jgi:GNAT superfamily N-acetyltransferase
MKSKINIITVDYHNHQQAEALTSLMAIYAKDPMGGGQTLEPKVLASLVKELAKREYAFSVLAYVNDQAVGLINCFEAFSTFKARPLVNIHDVIVHKDYRGLGLSQKMLEKIELLARDRGCCKLTLEVLEGNAVARSAYEKFGFKGYELDPGMGKALFWEKKLS